MRVNEKQAGLAVYGLGGTGINNVNRMVDSSGVTGFADTTIYRIDTSRSNVIDDDVFLIPGMNGAGKDPAKAYLQAKPLINKILTDLPPKDFNVVIYGLSGASGNASALLIAEELLNRDNPVILIGVISVASKKETENALKSINNLASIAARTNKPLTLVTYINDEDGTQQDINTVIEELLRSISMLTSGQNLRLDSSDLKNWLRFDLVTNVAPQLVSLIVTTTDKMKKRVEEEELTVISLASLLNSEAESAPALNQPYDTVGYYAPETINAFSESLPNFSFAITNSVLNKLIEKLDLILEGFIKNEERANATQLKTSINLGKQTAQTDGFNF